MTAKQTKTTTEQKTVQTTLAIDDPAETPLPASFEDAYAELQHIVDTMESGNMSLEDSLSAYQRGDVLLQFCQQTLSGVEQQVQLLNSQNMLESYQADENQA